jgi:hypothetical protein
LVAFVLDDIADSMVEWTFRRGGREVLQTSALGRWVVIGKDVISGTILRWFLKSMFSFLNCPAA